MAQQKDADVEKIRGQYDRLGSFLIASAFLVAVFVQLVVADKHSALVDVCTLRFLVHAVAILGMFISALYGFMNFRLWLADKGQLHTIHTFLIPAVFLLFWLAAWCKATHGWLAVPLVGGFLLVCLVLDEYRKPIRDKLLWKLPTLPRRMNDTHSQSQTQQLADTGSNSSKASHTDHHSNKNSNDR